MSEQQQKNTKAPRGKPTKAAVSDRLEIRPEDIDPHHDWTRLNAHGVMNVDFGRLHRYRLGRARQAVRNSTLGALLCFDNNNIRYITSTAIGEWSRDKFCRFAVLTGNGEPHLWDFGSAAAHHRMHAPWLPQDHCRAGMLGLRGTVPPDHGLVKSTVKEIKALLIEHGVAEMPLGVDLVEPPVLFELQRQGIKVRDCQQVMLDARELKNIDEIT